MKSLTKVFVLSVMILLVGFTIVTNEEDFAPVNTLGLEPANDQTIEEITSPVTYSDLGEMTASWYGPRFHGKMTANGEIFDENSYTAAHKQYSFGTLLKITNPKNNKSIIVRINDRGPYIAGRQLDLSKASAHSLGVLDRGVVKVRVEELSLKGVDFPVITLN